MSEAFLMRRGGSVNNAYALIAVSYPANSTCTAAKGTKMLTARSNNGAYCFLIPESGTWAVTITDGTNTATRDVVISSAGQVEKLIMVYTRDLFDSGDGAENWEAVPENYASIGSTIQLRGDHGDVTFGSKRAYGYLKNAISLSGMQTLEVIATTGHSQSNLPYAGHAQVRVVESGTIYSGTPVAAIDLELGSDKTTSLDISELDDSKTYCVVLYAAGDILDEGGVAIDTLDVSADVSKVRVY